ncbi:MAG TPA: S1C family serine protease [Gemmatimonadaceae bacterium]|nr:S1C family serine protease [Gemmatimonadaceae bacterium]
MATTLSNDTLGRLPQAVTHAARSIVAIHARPRIPASGIYWRDGVIVAASHTIKREQDISVTVAGGAKRPATLAGRDPTTDLAVLRIDGTGVTVAELVASDTLAVGQPVLAVGRPGADVTASFGIVSALGPGWRTWRGGVIDRELRLDLRVLDGFSGGGLVTAAGAIAGINNSALARGAAFSIPVSTVDRVVDQLLASGRIRRGYLGVGIQPVRLRDGSTGTIVVGVEPESPAERSGVLLGDVLVAIDGVSVGDADDLMTVLAGDRIGRTVVVRVVRAGEAREMSVTIAERP